MGRRIAAVDPALCDPAIHAWRGPGSGHIGQGHNIQGTLCSRGATSKKFRSGTHQLCIKKTYELRSEFTEKYELITGEVCSAPSFQALGNE